MLKKLQNATNIDATIHQQKMPKHVANTIHEHNHNLCKNIVTTIGFVSASRRVRDLTSINKT